MTAVLSPRDRVHLIGIAGAGMNPLARILLARGHAVSGSDLHDSAACDELRALGATVHVGHDARQVGDAQVVAVSTAVNADNPELQAAQRRGIAVWHRAELLNALMAGRTSLLVAGTHGKTTTTSMLAVALTAAGLDPSYAIGGALQGSGASAHAGQGRCFVAEADESDRSFLSLDPDLAVVTNVEWDHHDHYDSLDDTIEVFAQFLARRSADGPALLCADDDGARRVAALARQPVVTYGTAPDADVRIVEIEQHPGEAAFKLQPRPGAPGLGSATYRIQVPGLHNVRNATAAIIAAHWAGASDEAVVPALAEFAGAQRRFQVLGQAADVTVIDDYAHHPTEIDATLAAARSAYPGARLLAAFQPHRYSRTAALGEALGRSLAAADMVLVAPVYAAGEQPLPNADAGVVARAAAAAGAGAHAVHTLDELLVRLQAEARAGDVILTLGAGDITTVGPRLLPLLEAAR